MPRFLTILTFPLLLAPGLANAGPNAGGVLVVHANASLTYTSDSTEYCGSSGLTACSLVVATTPADGVARLFHVMAAFPSAAAPALKAVSFGVTYDSTAIVIVAHGTCADFEVPDGRWPRPGTGTAQSWSSPVESTLADVYWFAAYSYQSASLDLTPHPRQGGVFVDDSVPPVSDAIAGYGTLGFGQPGGLPCPQADAPPEGGGEEPEALSAFQTVPLRIAAE